MKAKSEEEDEVAATNHGLSPLSLIRSLSLNEEESDREYYNSDEGETPREVYNSESSTTTTTTTTTGSFSISFAEKSDSLQKPLIFTTTSTQSLGTSSETTSSFIPTVTVDNFSIMNFLASELRITRSTSIEFSVTSTVKILETPLILKEPTNQDLDSWSLESTPKNLVEENEKQELEFSFDKSRVDLRMPPFRGEVNTPIKTPIKVPTVTPELDYAADGLRPSTPPLLADETFSLIPDTLGLARQEGPILVSGDSSSSTSSTDAGSTDVAVLGQEEESI